MIKPGLLIYAIQVQSKLEVDYGLRGMKSNATAQFAEDFIHDSFIDETPIADCAFRLANEIQSGRHASYIFRRD